MYMNKKQNRPCTILVSQNSQKSNFVESLHNDDIYAPKCLSKCHMDIIFYPIKRMEFSCMYA